MRLEDIGFYTLSDERAKNIGFNSPLHRCELILTDRCNFNCPYCRGVKDPFRGDLDFEVAKDIVDMWCANGLKNIRFSGGEPTMYPGLDLLVKRAANGGVKRIALSTNGSAPFEVYQYLISLGVNDFSISLDACCSSTGRTMAGGVDVWDVVVANIEALSKLTYVTVGVVLTDTNVNEVVDTIRFADKLGVSDIRVISSAQENALINGLSNVEKEILDRNPILRYRVRNYMEGRNVRGIRPSDSHTCFLMLDDMAVLGGQHFPCIIYMREGGDPVGEMNNNTREDRLSWVMSHDIHKDPICAKNCLDVCIDYNNRVNSFLTVW
jgi:molybdenum cofactor biosynthesis enzyme MoaA